MKNDLVLANSLPELFILLHPKIKTYRYFIRLNIIFFWLKSYVSVWFVEKQHTSPCHFWKKSYIDHSIQFSFSVVSDTLTPWTAARQASLSTTKSQSFLKLMSIQSVMPSNHLILCCPLLLLQSIFPSIRIFFSESVLPIRWPEYWSFSFSISPSNEYSGLISFRIDWFDLLAVQEILSGSKKKKKKRTGVIHSFLRSHLKKISSIFSFSFKEV